MSDLKIVGVDLVRESLRSHQELNNARTDAYPVAVTLSRRVSEFEAQAIEREFGMIVHIGNPADPTVVIIPNTTIEAIRDDLGKYNGRIATAAGMGRRAAADAAKEDDRRREVATTINAHILRDEYMFGSATS